MQSVDWDKKMLYIKNITTSAANFVGKYDSSKYYEYGDVCIRNGGLYIYSGFNWHSLGLEEEAIHERTLKYITNCPNCGAPMQNHRCAYCGTEDYGK